MLDGIERLEFVPADYFERATVAELFPERPDAPLELDLGSGDGRFLLDLAAAFPERNFLGVERLLGRVRRVCRRAERLGLENVRVLRLESGYAVHWLLPRGAFARVHLLFPDPWPKLKHRARRLLSPEFLQGIDALLGEDGEFLFKSDHEEYFETSAGFLRQSPGWEELLWEDGAFFYPETDFEQRWKAAGKPIRSLRLRKIGRESGP